MRRTPLLLAAVLGFCLVLSSSAYSAGVLRREMNQRLPELKFQGITFSDAIDFFRDVTNANIVVNWKALEGAGITRDSQVNLHLNGVTLRKALDLVLNEVAGGDTLTYAVEDGVIEITTRELADRKMVTRVYPVEDLIMIIPDFTDAPQFSLDASQNQSGGGSSGGGGGITGGTTISNSLFANAGQLANQQNQNQGPTKAERAKELVDLIEAVVFPDIWTDNGGTASIRYFNGMLIVTAPISVQEAIGGEYD